MKGALSRDEAADYLSISVDALDRLKAAGEIAFVKLGKEGAKKVRVIFPVFVLEQFLEQRCQTTSSSRSATPPAGTSSGKRAADRVALQRIQKTVRRQRTA